VEVHSKIPNAFAGAGFDEKSNTQTARRQETSETARILPDLLAIADKIAGIHRLHCKIVSQTLRCSSRYRASLDLHDFIQGLNIERRIRDCSARQNEDEKKRKTQARFPRSRQETRSHYVAERTKVAMSAREEEKEKRIIRDPRPRQRDLHHARAPRSGLLAGTNLDH
jgi:hypothetical protein